MNFVQTAVMVISDWRAVVIPYKVVWRCAMMECGEQCAVIIGLGQMLKWLVNN